MWESACVLFPISTGAAGPLAFSVNFPQVIAQLRPDAEISFDDGKATGRIVAVNEEGAELEIIAARAKGPRLKPAKGVNFPSIDLKLSPLTSKDLVDLDFVARSADLVGFSFVQRVEDVVQLQAELAARRWGKTCTNACPQDRNAACNP